MVNQRMIVAWMFRIGALLFGVPALIGLIDIIANLILLERIAPHIQPGQPLDIQKYGIVGMLADGGNLIGLMLSFVAGLGILAAILLATVLTILIAVSSLFFFTGNGVARRADWAKVMGIVLSALCLLFWLGGLHAAQNGDADVTSTIVTATGIAASAYAIWVLGWRYTA
jgi:hypothetical protein